MISSFNTRIIYRNYLIIVFWFSFGVFSPATAQLIQVSVPPTSEQNIQKKRQSLQRTQSTPKSLPFWDDFSFPDGYLPQDSLWVERVSTAINNEVGINPPSIGVITFDGYDSTGKPYNKTEVLAKGFADRLVSRELRLDEVPIINRPDLFFSFYFQAQGNGEAPDAGDILQLAFKDENDAWNVVWSQENGPDIDPNIFYQINIPILDPSYYHDGFQFRFQNFARLSGPYDTWLVDYVFLDWNRGFSIINDQVGFPDRSITSIPSPFFNEYRSMPYTHFLSDIPGNLSNPVFQVFNNCNEGAQPMDFNSKLRITSFEDNVETIHPIILLDNDVSTGNALLSLTSDDVTTLTLPTIADFNTSWDSLYLNYRIELTSQDESGDPLVDNDCDFTAFPLTDFTLNDTVQTRYQLSDYYAYDDGTAEYGAGLQQAGGQVAYLFDLKTTEPAVLTYIDLYFPRFGLDNSTVIQIKIMDNINTSDGSVLYAANVPIRLSEQNKFWRLKLDKAVVVQNQFYVGWKQFSSNLVAIGLDNSNDSGGKIFFNTVGTWEANTNVSGSLMIRPGFGTDDGIVTRVKSEKSYAVYPNPTSGSFYLPPTAEQIELFTTLGQPVSFAFIRDIQHTVIRPEFSGSGLLIVRFFDQGAWHTSKVMIKVQ
jgi:hypothetical protein